VLAPPFAALAAFACGAFEAECSEAAELDTASACVECEPVPSALGEPSPCTAPGDPHAASAAIVMDAIASRFRVVLV
jgi:hypothetical protein